jgi:Transposase, Mutator family
MYARGMSTRDVQGHLEEMYGVEVSPALISQVTDSVIEEVRAWQNRPLEPIYLIVYLDALLVKMRRGAGGKPGRIRRNRSDAGRNQRGTGIVDQRYGGRQVMAANSDRDAQPRSAGHPGAVYSM